MPEPADEEAAIQQMLLSLLTNRQPEPVQEQTPLDAARGAKAVEMMQSPYWQGSPMYYEPAAAYNYTDQGVHELYLDRLVNDAERQATGIERDPAYEDAWEQGMTEDVTHPDWALREGTPPYYRMPQYAR